MTSKDDLARLFRLQIDPSGAADCFIAVLCCLLYYMVLLLIYTVPNVLCLMYAMYCQYWVVGDPVLYGAVIDASLCCGLLYSLILQYNKCSSVC